MMEICGPEFGISMWLRLMLLMLGPKSIRVSGKFELEFWGG